MSINPIILYLKNTFENKKINIIEVGARYGESSIIMMDNLNVNKYIIIDPYESYDEYKSDDFNNIIKNKEDIIFNDVNKLLKNKFPNIDIIFHRGYSNHIKILNEIDDNSIDLVFIDANHSYKYVLEDLENYFPKLKIGGVLCGDDYFMRTYENDILNSGAGYDEPMVYEAVQEYSTKYNLEILEFGEHRKYSQTYAFIKHNNYSNKILLNDIYSENKDRIIYKI